MERDSELYARMKEHLYSKKPLLGEDSPFSELLQSMVDQMLDAEIKRKNRPKLSPEEEKVLVEERQT